MLSHEGLIQRVTTIEGTRPTAAPIPPPGIYWIKQMRCDSYWIDAEGTRLDHPTHNQIYSVWTWDLRKESVWLLAEVDEHGNLTYIGSDENESWESRTRVTTRVGPRVDLPTEER